MEPILLPSWQAARLDLLLDAVADLPLSLGERAALVVLARQEQATVEHLAAIITRARTTAQPGHTQRRADR